MSHNTAKQACPWDVYNVVYGN